MSIDFITKLPKSKDPVTRITYNSIMVIVDRFTKYLIVAPFKETHTVEQLGYLLLDRLVRDHGVPITVITDVTTQGWEPLIYRQSGHGPGKRTPWKSSDQPTRGHVTVKTHGSLDA